MAPRKFELRFTIGSQPGNQSTTYAANQIGRYFSNSGVRHLGYFIPHYDATKVVFKFSSMHQMENVESCFAMELVVLQVKSYLLTLSLGPIGRRFPSSHLYGME